MQRIKMILLGLLLLPSLGLAAVQPISVTIRNNSSLDLQVNPSKLQAANIVSNDLKALQQQTILGQSSQTFTFRTTGQPVRLFLVFRTTATEPERSGIEVGQWEYVESPDGVMGCHNIHSNGSFNISCASNNSLLQPEVSLTINDSQSYEMSNVGPLTVNIINRTDVDLVISPGKSKNMSAYDLQQMAGEEVYARGEHTILISRNAYPAHMYITLNTSQAEGSHSSRVVGEWEYMEDDQLAYACHRILPVYPYNMTCYGTSDIAEPSVTITVTSPSSQPFPLPN